jgi:SAM-dependent methyltransferase
MKPVCRLCSGSLRLILPLGDMPIVNYFPTTSEVVGQEKYPLNFFVCDRCGLAQIPDLLSPQKNFREYHYLTGASAPLVKQLDAFVTDFLGQYPLDPGGRVLDIGTNDGTLLSLFARRGRGGGGVEPAKNVAAIAQKNGHTIVPEFFSSKLAKHIRKIYGRFDLVTATHVLANVPDVKDFVAGVSDVLAPDGLAVFEVGSLVEMLKYGQFDAIYHEHYSYFSFSTLKQLLATAGLSILSVTKHATQGGSLRVVSTKHPVSPDVRYQEPITPQTYRDFVNRVQAFRKQFRKLVSDGKTIVGWGAPAKAVTLLTYCGIDQRQIMGIVDTTPVKQGRVLPGVGIPIYEPQWLQGKPVDTLVILAWNYLQTMEADIRAVIPRGTSIIIPFPKLRVARW